MFFYIFVVVLSENEGRLLTLLDFHQNQYILQNDIQTRVLFFTCVEPFVLGRFVFVVLVVE